MNSVHVLVVQNEHAESQDERVRDRGAGGNAQVRQAWIWRQAVPR